MRCAGYRVKDVDNELERHAPAPANERERRETLCGDTGIDKLGLSLAPSASLLLSIDLGVQGYVGRCEGVNGSLQVKYEF